MAQTLLPKKIILEENVENSQSLLKEKTLQIGLKEQDIILMKKGSRILLDFGKEINGGVRILTLTASKGNKVRLVFGESVVEALSKIGENNSTNDHATRDMVVELQTFSDLTFGGTGFRFLLIECDNNTELKIKSIVADVKIFDKPFEGSFSCDDQVINQIFDTSCYTLRLCLQNGMVWDGIKRDRLVWIGDMHPEVLGLCHTFGKLDNIENSLTFIKDQTALPNWMNEIPMYSLWWIIILRDYYKFVKNVEYLKKQQDYLIGLVNLINENINQDGSTGFKFNFIDWNMHITNEKDTIKYNDQLAGVHALTILAIKSAKEIFDILKFKNNVCDQLLSRLYKHRPTVLKYKQASALRVLAGIGTEKDKSVLVEGGATGLTTFMSYYILKALDVVGIDSLDIMKTYYKSMLDLGATTFFEEFEMGWMENASRIDEMPVENKTNVHSDCGDHCFKGLRKSLCHGWSCGPIQYLMEVVAGIKVVSDGAKKIEIKPKLFNLKNVKAKFPTPYGILEVEHRKDIKGKIKTTYKAPKAINVVISK